MRHFFFISLVLGASLVMLMPARAQVQRSGGDAQKFMQQYQQIAAERTALQAQLTQALKDLEAAKVDLAAVKKERDALKSRSAGVPAQQVAQLIASKEAAEKSVEVSKQRTNELVGRFREVAANLKDVESDRVRLRKEVEERNAALDKCAEDNLQLYEISGEVLDRYEHAGFFTKASAAEPFTRITRTRMENLVVEYRQRAQLLRVKKPAT
jgi:chromosome segregation ATPase